jgi:hypothetical protein
MSESRGRPQVRPVEYGTAWGAGFVGYPTNLAYRFAAELVGYPTDLVGREQAVPLQFGRGFERLNIGISRWFRLMASASRQYPKC